MQKSEVGRTERARVVPAAAQLLTDRSARPCRGLGMLCWFYQPAWALLVVSWMWSWLLYHLPEPCSQNSYLCLFSPSLNGDHPLPVPPAVTNHRSIAGSSVEFHAEKGDDESVQQNTDFT
ncbi:unnamed protein product [Rangifer tarandus platyrhynchus]|uniref:Uncharacterized protein n=2 Tax=Rangifer tarandus platyrhynchus TaxID=3082113 RepID=A0ABN8ZPE4_RANTA|nr:unnamed protein product [Rangifer tarandus platyrhynchus]